MKYYINGWREGKSYFLQLGRFSEEELRKLELGEVITKDNNEFYMEG